MREHQDTLSDTHHERDRDVDWVDFAQSFLDGVAEECGGYPVAIGLGLLLWGMIGYVAIYR
jgi:hypothetical protein